MKPPANTQLYETTIFTHWVDENGIVCGITKPGERNVKNFTEVFDIFKTISKNGEKLCLLGDVNFREELFKETREYVISEMPKYIKAFAMISETALGANQANTFLKLTMSGFPIKVFPNAAEGKEWLKEFL